MRTRPALAVVAIVLAVGATLAGGLPGASAAAESGEPTAAEAVGADHYPQRIRFPLLDRDPDRLPARPGPLAATFVNNNYGNPVLMAVSPDGDLWRLRYSVHALSPDGRLLLRDDQTRRRRMVVQDLVSGSTTPLGRVHARHSGPRRMDYQYPIQWAPDGSAIEVAISDRGRRFRPAVVDAATGEVTQLGRGILAGFSGPDRALTLVPGTGDGVPARLRTTRLSTGRSTSRPMDAATPLRGDLYATLASVSPDGRTLVVAGAEGDRGRLRLFSLPDGRELAPRRIRIWEGPRCGVNWLDGDPVLPINWFGRPGGSVQVTATEARPLVALEPRLQGGCIHWADDALAGGHEWSLFGTNSDRWTWYWYLALPPLLVLLLLAYGVWRLLLRRRRRGARAGRSTDEAEVASRHG